MAEHPLFAPYLQEEGAVEAEAPINPLSEGLAQLKFGPDHNTPEGSKLKNFLLFVGFAFYLHIY